MEDITKPVDQQSAHKPVVTQPSPKNGGTKKVLLAVLLLIIAGLVGGYFYMNKKDNTSPGAVKNGATDQAKDTTAAVVKEEIPTTVAANCASTSGAKTFYNKIIALQFCYPKEWGEATIGKVPASASVKGGSYEIIFSAKQGLTIDSATADWKNTIARDGRCADPQTEGPQFSTYQQEWKTEKNGSVAFSAQRVHIKKEPQYLIKELVSEYYSGVCLTGIATTTGGAYATQTVNLYRQYTDAVTDVEAHIANPLALITSEERTQFNELVASLVYAK